MLRVGGFLRRVPVTSDDEIGELAVAFNNMAASLSSSEGTRRSFIANVSHELKTPMTTIAGFIDGILDGTIPPDKQNYYLKLSPRGKAAFPPGKNHAGSFQNRQR